MKRYTINRCVAFDPETDDKIRDLKSKFGLSFSEVIRECVEFDLPRLINRHIQARKRGQGRYRDSHKPPLTGESDGNST